MLKIYIPTDLQCSVSKKLLFILVRPFYSENGWVIDENRIIKWGIVNGAIKLVLDITSADFILLPFSINYYYDNGLLSYLDKYNKLCEKNNIRAFAFVAGDTSQTFPEYDNLIYFRMGGFRLQLSEKNIGLPAALSDYHMILFGSKNITLRKKNNKPIVGFCGHANSSQLKRSKESLMHIIENIKRFIKNPTRTDYETIFPSGYIRYKMLNILEKADTIKSNFIYRKSYRAGSYSMNDRKKTTLEYYNNIRESDYVLCLRGGGNFSRRFYETLLMGRIPIFINTDCILPLIDQIDWKKHVVWIEWKERDRIVEIVSQFHNNLSDDAFQDLQLSNRKLWLEKLQTCYILEHCLQ